MADLKLKALAVKKKFKLDAVYQTLSPNHWILVRSPKSLVVPIKKLDQLKEEHLKVCSSVDTDPSKLHLEKLA